MQWEEVTARPSPRKLREFGGLWLLFFCGLAAWRAYQSGVDARVAVMAALGAGIGIMGLVSPSAIRFVYTAWMILAFPIGWTVSRIALALVFFAVFTPAAMIFRVMGRDALHRRRLGTDQSYWASKPNRTASDDYFRQF